ncbi:hypothetical protein JZ751_001650 [Albula glossodonta]|uniref:Uncharacterized protein n=1 Tax=Albula glossodonta TaxID=121402 RepID=A0A8T2PU26_9TELE|nr:hypothetical protein JZ751_001650 [Albula glossodonta]
MDLRYANGKVHHTVAAMDTAGEGATPEHAEMQGSLSRSVADESGCSYRVALFRSHPHGTAESWRSSAWFLPIRTWNTGLSPGLPQPEGGADLLWQEDTVAIEEAVDFLEVGAQREGAAEGMQLLSGLQERQKEAGSGEHPTCRSVETWVYQQGQPSRRRCLP